jgi:hypothetical protein
MRSCGVSLAEAKLASNASWSYWKQQGRFCICRCLIAFTGGVVHEQTHRELGERAGTVPCLRA